MEILIIILLNAFIISKDIEYQNSPSKPVYHFCDTGWECLGNKKFTSCVCYNINDVESENVVITRGKECGLAEDICYMVDGKNNGMIVLEEIK